MLEQKIEALTVAIVSLTDILKANGGVSAGAADAKADTKADAKADAKGGKGGKGSTSTKNDDAATSTHTLAELQKVLNDYKEVFGMPKAKKLLPDLGYANSKAVPVEKIDEVFDHVSGLLEAEANKDDGEGDL